jgi:hypothetical protein
MFLGQIRFLRNVTIYVHRPDQEAEEHKVYPYIPLAFARRPEEHNPSAPKFSWSCLRPLPSHPVFRLAFSAHHCFRRSAAPDRPHPAHPTRRRIPTAPAPSGPRTDHPGPAQATHRPPQLQAVCIAMLFYHYSFYFSHNFYCSTRC